MSSTLPTVDSSSRVFNHGNTSTELSPAAAFRNKYYLSQQQEEEVEEEDDFIYRPGAIIYAPLNPPGIKLTDQVYDDEDDTEEEEYTLFESKSTFEPKIVLDDKENKLNSTLLSKLSKSTAPMRAKLSKSKSKGDNLKKKRGKKDRR